MRYLISYIHSFTNRYYHRKFLFDLAKRMGLDHLGCFQCRKSDAVYFRNIIDIKALYGIDSDKTFIGDLWRQYYKNHRFNVLGTGWIKWTYDEVPLGFENIKINSEIREEFRTKIAWCRDMRTGYCFNQDSLAADFFDKLEKGADIKVPWELARMYHWPQLALLAIWNMEERNDIIDEFIFEIEDFEKIPTGKSIQYSCAMEIAIRSINLLIAFDIFTQIDKDHQLNADFNRKFISLMREHQEMILNRLEVNLESRKNGNHYLADLCGLLFLCSYIQGGEARQCFEFACGEFLNEINRQFLEDGTNIECSTAYHRLSSEISILGVMMIRKQGKKIPEALQGKLQGMREFLCMITKPDGRILQIGDNDSGHVLCLNPQGKYIDKSELGQYNVNWKNYRDEKEKFFVQEELYADQTIAMFDAYLDKSDPKDQVSFGFYRSFIAGEKYNAAPLEGNFEDNKVKISNINLKELCFKKDTVFAFAKKYNFCEKDIDISTCFGLIVIRVEDLFLAIRIVPEYKRMRLGHVHNDIFHYELALDGKGYFSDPGSYVYTGYKEWRDKFRADIFHNVPVYKDKWIKPLSMFCSKAEVTGNWFIDHNVITLIGRYKNITHVRRFLLCDDKLVVEDYSNQEFKLNKRTNPIIYSLGYGMRNEE